MKRILLIEDEIKIARELKTLIENLREDMQVVDIIPSIKSAIKWFAENEIPDLIFSDIQLADGLSFEIFRQLDINAPIIFCTAYDEYAIQAFDTNGIDYLLKPIDEKKLAHGLAKYNKYNPLTEEAITYQSHLDQLLAQMEKPYKNSLLIHFQDKIIPIRVTDIDFIHSEGGIVTIYLNNKQRHYTNHTLDALENMLDPRLFFKASRQFIINRNAIASIEHYFTRRLSVKLTQPTPDSIIVSKARASEFLKWIEKN